MRISIFLDQLCTLTGLNWSGGMCSNVSLRWEEPGWMQAPDWNVQKQFFFFRSLDKHINVPLSGSIKHMRPAVRLLNVCVWVCMCQCVCANMCGVRVQTNRMCQ